MFTPRRQLPQVWNSMPGKPRHQDTPSAATRSPLAWCRLPQWSKCALMHVKTVAEVHTCSCAGPAAGPASASGARELQTAAALLPGSGAPAWTAGGSVVSTRTSQESRSTSMPGAALGKASDTDVDAVCWRLLTQFDGSRRKPLHFACAGYIK